MEDYILREINRIGELIAALLNKIGLMRQSASPEQIRTTAKTELAEKLDIDIDTLLDEIFNFGIVDGRMAAVDLSDFGRVDVEGKDLMMLRQQRSHR